MSASKPQNRSFVGGEGIPVPATPRQASPKWSPPAARPRVFIGSSAEGLAIARAIQANLDRFAACTIWTQGVFGLGLTNIENLVNATRRHDFAILVASADDIVNRRGRSNATARDNVIFELGLFMGALGRDRTFVVFDRDRRPLLPTDLDGLGGADFSMVGHSDPISALGAPCTAIERMIRDVLAAQTTASP